MGIFGEINYVIKPLEGWEKAWDAKVDAKKEHRKRLADSGFSIVGDSDDHMSDGMKREVARHVKDMGGRKYDSLIGVMDYLNELSGTLTQTERMAERKYDIGMIKKPFFRKEYVISYRALAIYGYGFNWSNVRGDIFSHPVARIETVKV